MNVDLIENYREILDGQGIQFLLIPESLKGLDSIDYYFRKTNYKDYDYNDMLDVIKKQCQNNHVLFYKDDFNLNYCFIKLPKLLQREYKTKYIIIGPVIYRYISQKELENVLSEHDFPLSLSRDLLEFYNRVPTLATHDFWVSLLIPLLKALFGNKGDYSFIDMNKYLNPKVQKNEHELKESDNKTSFQAVADRYQAEENMLNSVTQGNLKEALERFHKFRQFNVAPRTPDNIRNAKNFLIVFNTNLRQAIAKADIHPYYIDELSRQFAVRIETTNNISQLESLSVIMLRKYTMLVHNFTTKNYSAIVKKCIEKIRFEYNEAINLESLATFCAVTPNYLSMQFHKETGETITNYIQNTRLKEAIILLNSSNKSIQEIASLSGFTDSNYFTRIFKKKKGITPKEYRNSINS